MSLRKMIAPWSLALAVGVGVFGLNVQSARSEHTGTEHTGAEHTGAEPIKTGHGGIPNEACSALHAAAFLDEPDEARTLLAHGADVNCLDVLGQTPLITAVNGASLATFELLLSAGARVDVRTEFGQTLLAHAEKKYASFSAPNAGTFRVLYSAMVRHLKIAGALNEDE
jgi:hypothetical protein